MPRAAYNRNALEPFLLGGSNRLPHPRFTFGLTQYFSLSPGRCSTLFDWLIGGQSRFAQRRHRFQDRGEEIGAVMTMLDQMFPPAFAVAVTGGCGQLAYRVVVDLSFGI